MYAVEFQTRVENGAIPIPEEYRDRFTGPVRVIVMGADELGTDNMIDELLEKPLKIADFKPLTRSEIYEQK